ncbi:MAG: hypothetical protein KDB69_08965, partial [Acidimicrobiia bacterium]|nr:hypothetical protein [Acidimicrobiia bacterium]
QGALFLSLGALLLIVALATAWEGSLKPAVSAAIVGFVVVAATGVALIFGDRDISLTLNPVNSAVLAILLAGAFAVSLRSLLGASVGLFKRALPVFAVMFVALFGLAFATVMDTTVTSPLWVAVFVVFLAIGALTLAIRPLDMGANRMLIVATVAVWATIVFSAGAIRETLIDTQLTTEQSNGVIGIAAQYKDVQAASGWWLAGFGATIAFVGAVGIWAKRRDLVAALARARKQRAAAEESAREIAEAEEAYRQEFEGVNG